MFASSQPKEVVINSMERILGDRHFEHEKGQTYAKLITADILQRFSVFKSTHSFAVNVILLKKGTEFLCHSLNSKFLSDIYFREQIETDHWTAIAIIVGMINSNRKKHEINFAPLQKPIQFEATSIFVNNIIGESNFQMSKNIVYEVSQQCKQKVKEILEKHFGYLQTCLICKVDSNLYNYTSMIGIDTDGYLGFNVACGKNLTYYNLFAFSI